MTWHITQKFQKLGTSRQLRISVIFEVTVCRHIEKHIHFKTRLICTLKEGPQNWPLKGVCFSYWNDCFYFSSQLQPSTDEPSKEKVTGKSQDTLQLNCHFWPHVTARNSEQTNKLKNKLITLFPYKYNWLYYKSTIYLLYW